ncbi:GDSL-type esterase/lipase family protein [Clostridium perfringens]|nr:GDSL-type esterase/lipase family protein [Clostridium perfringens]
MAKKDIKFTLDTIDSRYSPIGTVKQLDSVFFHIKITENGVTKDLTGQTIKLFAIKEDKKIVEQTTQINITNQSEGLVEIELLNAAIQVHGFTYFELEISDNTGIISTSDFILRVDRKVGSDEAIESTNEVATLKEIEIYVAQAKVELQRFKELQTEMLRTNETINSNEEGRVLAEENRVQAEEARIEAEQQREQSLVKINEKTDINTNKLEGFKVIENILNPENFVVGGLSSAGELTDVQTNFCSDYISVQGEKKYFRLNSSLMLISFYDEFKKHIYRKDISSFEFTTPPNARFIRCTDKKDFLLKEVISSSRQYEYVDYTPLPKYKIDDSYITSFNRENLSDSFLSNAKFVDGQDLNVFNKGGAFVLTNPVNGPISSTCLILNVPFLNDGALRWTVQFLLDFSNGDFFTRKSDIGNSTQSKWIKHDEVNFAKTNKLKGKKWVFFGDSITEGVGSTNAERFSYPSRIRDKYNINVINKAIAGASWQEDGKYDNICVLTQIKNADLADVDIATIFAGTNDFGRGALPIGTENDMVKNTLYGAINNAIKMLIEKKSNLKIFVITPMWRQRFSAGDNKDSDCNDINGKYLKDYVDAIINACRKNHIPVLNFYYNCSINKYNYTTFLADGLHPNDKGYDEILSERIFNFVESNY